MGTRRARGAVGVRLDRRQSLQRQRRRTHLDVGVELVEFVPLEELLEAGTATLGELDDDQVARLVLDKEAGEGRTLPSGQLLLQLPDHGLELEAKDGFLELDVVSRRVQGGVLDQRMFQRVVVLSEGGAGGGEDSEGQQ